MIYIYILLTLHAWYIMHGICTIHTYISYTAHTVHVIDTSFSSHSRSRTLLTRASLLDAGNNGLWARRGSRRNILQETGTFHVQLRTRCSCCSSFGVSQSREVTSLWQDARSMQGSDEEAQVLRSGFPTITCSKAPWFTVLNRL